MRTSRVIIALVVAGVVLVSAWQLAVAAPRRGELRVRFIRLVERRVGDREYLGILVRPLEGKGETVLLMGRDSKQAKVARTLREGQKVEVAYVIEGDHKWATRISAARLREGGDRRRREGEDKRRREGEGRRREGEDRRRREGEGRRREAEDRRRREAGRRPATRHDVERLLVAIRRLEERIGRLEREVRLLREQRGEPGRDGGDGDREEGRRREGGDRDRDREKSRKR